MICAFDDSKIRRSLTSKQQCNPENSKRIRKDPENEVSEETNLKTVMPDNNWQDKRVFLRDSSKPIHRPSVYFIDLALPMIFENHASAHASMADDALSKIARKAI